MYNVTTDTNVKYDNCQNITENGKISATGAYQVQRGKQAEQKAQTTRQKLFLQRLLLILSTFLTHEKQRICYRTLSKCLKDRKFWYDHFEIVTNSLVVIMDCSWLYAKKVFPFISTMYMW